MATKKATKKPNRDKLGRFAKVKGTKKKTVAAKKAAKKPGPSYYASEGYATDGDDDDDGITESGNGNAPPSRKLTLSEIKKAVGSTPKDALSAIDKIKNLLGDKDRWIKGALAEDNDGDTEVESGTRFCLLGAINRVDGPSEDVVKLAIALAAQKLFPERCNDGLSEVEGLLYDLENDSYSDELPGFFDENGEIDIGHLEDAAVFNFNDDDATTHADVMAVIEQGRKNLLGLEVLAEAYLDAQETVRNFRDEAAETLRRMLGND